MLFEKKEGRGEKKGQEFVHLSLTHTQLSIRSHERKKNKKTLYHLYIDQDNHPNHHFSRCSSIQPTLRNIHIDTALLSLLYHAPPPPLLHCSFYHRSPYHPTPLSTFERSVACTIRAHCSCLDTAVVVVMVVQYSEAMFGEMSLMLLAFVASASGDLFPGVTTQVVEELDAASKPRWHRRGVQR